MVVPLRKAKQSVAHTITSSLLNVKGVGPAMHLLSASSKCSPRSRVCLMRIRDVRLGSLLWRWEVVPPLIHGKERGFRNRAILSHAKRMQLSYYLVPTAVTLYHSPSPHSHSPWCIKSGKLAFDATHSLLTRRRSSSTCIIQGVQVFPRR